MSVETEIKSINGKTVCDSTARTAASAKYAKPDGGIPEADLASAVQAKLNREETDPTVPDWAKAESKPSYTAEEVGALPAGTAIPAPVSKTSAMTQPVGMDAAGKLWTAPGSGEGGGDVSLPVTTELLKGDGAGGAEEAVAGTDYATPAQVAAKYAKPSDGIPKTDLASAVQTSLGKADSAVQAAALNSYRTAADQDTRDDAKQPKTITDTNGYFTTDTVEGALAEIGAELAGINTLLGSGVIE